MRWARINDWVARRPDGYSIARFQVGEESVFRASFNGDFISQPTTQQEALAACKQHKENSDG